MHPDREVRPLRWAIIGSGVIAQTFARELRQTSRGVLIGMSSRDARRAAILAAKFDTHTVTNYEDLIKREDVDAVYVASPQTAHQENVLAALDAGKPVLCEKPFAMSEAESAIMIARARGKGLFLMEAMKTRFLPHMRFIKDAVEAGTIGRIGLMHLPMGVAFDRAKLPRLFDPTVGGGSRLDLGCYAVSMSQWLLGEPAEVSAVSYFGSGVDLQTAALLLFADGALASIELSITTAASNRAFLGGSDGSIQVEPAWWSPSNVTVATSKGDYGFTTPHLGEGLMPQVAEVQRCIASGALESLVMPLQDSRAVMRTLDLISAAATSATPPR